MKKFTLRLLLYGGPSVLLLARTILAEPILGAIITATFAAGANLFVWKAETMIPLPHHKSKFDPAFP